MWSAQPLKGPNAPASSADRLRAVSFAREEITQVSARIADINRASHSVGDFPLAPARAMSLGKGKVCVESAGSRPGLIVVGTRSTSTQSTA